MAMQALFPVAIMGAALGGMTFTSQSYNLRVFMEKSQAFERGLADVAGILPPRTRIDPFVTKPNPYYAERDIPIYETGRGLSQVVPGSKLDPYTNPIPTSEQWAAEDKKHPPRAEKILDKINRIILNKPDLYDPQVRRKLWEEEETKKFNEATERLRYHPMAEYYRIQEYAKRHPELELDAEKMKKFDLERMKYWY